MATYRSRRRRDYVTDAALGLLLGVVFALAGTVATMWILLS